MCMRVRLERGQERAHTGLLQVIHSRLEATGERPQIFISGRKSDDSEE